MRSPFWGQLPDSGGLLCSCASLKERACDDRLEEAREVLKLEPSMRRPVALRQQAMDISIDAAVFHDGFLKRILSSLLARWAMD
jgi:hypothetical protein